MNTGVTERRPVTPVLVQVVGIGFLICSRAIPVVENIFDNTGRFARQVIAGVRQERQQQYVEFMTKSTMPSQN